MTLLDIKLAIWHHKKIHCNRVDLQVEADKHGISLPIDDIPTAQRFLDLLCKRKTKRKVETPKWCVQRYEAAHKAWFQTRYPACWKDGHYLGMEPEWPDVGTTNGITTLVINFITWSGGYANRLNVMGRKVGDTFIPSSTRKGTEDIDALWQGKKIAIEIKNAYTNDKIRPEQLKQQARIQAAGGIYIIVTGVENFFEQWDKIVNLA